MYYNKLTSRHIDDDSVVNITSTGIIVFNGSTWELISNEYLSTTVPKTISSDLTYEKYIRPINELATKESITAEKSMARYEYSIGLDYEFKKAQMAETAAFLFEKIEIEPNKQTIFKIKDKTSDYSSIEYYLIDGTKTYPILSYGTKMIQNEKIFPLLDTRFEIDTTQETIIRSDGDVTTIDRSELDTTKTNTISYYPKDAGIYYPTNSIIQIKAILRSYDTNKAAPEILNITVEQYDRLQEAN